MSSPSAAKVRPFVPEITFALNNGQALDLLFYDQASQSFQLNQDVVQMLLDVVGHVGFIFNIGEQGIGKTFTLNHIMDLPPHSGLQERTRGIKIWNKPLFKDSEHLYLYFVDVQGFSGDQVFRDFVWFMAFFLGTIVIYSTSGPIDDHTWRDMSSFDFIANRFILSEDPAENEYLISYYAPKLIWLLRDLPLPAMDSRTGAPDKYVENSLYEQTREDHSFVKTFFSNTFKDRTTVSFTPPTSQPPFAAPIQNMTSQYMENIKIIKERVYSKATNKYFDGMALTSRMVLNFITCLTELLNKKSVLNYNEV